MAYIKYRMIYTEHSVYVLFTHPLRLPAESRQPGNISTSQFGEQIILTRSFAGNLSFPVSQWDYIGAELFYINHLIAYGGSYKFCHYPRFTSSTLHITRHSQVNSCSLFSLCRPKNLTFSLPSLGSLNHRRRE